MTRTPLLRSIEQQLENLMSLDEDLAYQYDSKLYYDCDVDKPIVEKFTPELLTELENIVFNLETK